MARWRKGQKGERTHTIYLFRKVSQSCHLIFLLLSHQPDLYYTVTLSCKGGWEILYFRWPNASSETASSISKEEGEYGYEGPAVSATWKLFPWDGLAHWRKSPAIHRGRRLSLHYANACNPAKVRSQTHIIMYLVFKVFITLKRLFFSY